MSEYKNAPIQRHPSLAPLSRDHYIGLVQAQHLIKAGDTAQSDAVARRKAAAEFIDAWDHEICEHFEDEEKLLLPLMTQADRGQLLEEHLELRTDAKLLRAQRKEVDPDAAVMARMGSCLEKHIRWEERELFERLQNSLSPDQLADLQIAAQEVESHRDRTVCRTKPKQSASAAGE